MDWTPGTPGRQGMTPDALDSWRRLDALDRLPMPWTMGTDWRGTGARTHGLMRHDPMDWTMGTLGTMGNDALDFGD